MRSKLPAPSRVGTFEGMVSAVRWESMVDWPGWAFPSADGHEFDWTRKGDHTRYVTGLRARITTATVRWNHVWRLSSNSVNNPTRRAHSSRSGAQRGTLGGAGSQPVHLVARGERDRRPNDARILAHRSARGHRHCGLIGPLRAGGMDHPEASRRERLSSAPTDPWARIFTGDAADFGERAGRRDKISGTSSLRSGRPRQG